MDDVPIIDNMAVLDLVDSRVHTVIPVKAGSRFINELWIPALRFATA
jgi:hypothetical protein